MKKRFSLFLIASFLYMQVNSFLHMAEHAFEHHKHDEQVCEIVLHSEKAKYAFTYTPILTTTTLYSFISLPITLQSSEAYDRKKHFHSQAPPIFS